MGDSYASGQGANNYFDEDCRRSNNSYWALLRTHVKRNITSPQSDFTACTGATTDQVLEHQLSHLDTTTRLITLSVGGDNLHFATAMKKCVWPTGVTCTESIKDNINGKTLRALRKDLGELYRAIHKRAPQATVLVLGYPQLVDPDQIDGCGAMDDDDGPALHLAGERLNRAIKRGGQARSIPVHLARQDVPQPPGMQGRLRRLDQQRRPVRPRRLVPSERAGAPGDRRHAAPKWFD